MNPTPDNRVLSTGRLSLLTCIVADLMCVYVRVRWLGCKTIGCGCECACRHEDEVWMQVRMPTRSKTNRAHRETRADSAAQQPTRSGGGATGDHSNLLRPTSSIRCRHTIRRCSVDHEAPMQHSRCEMSAQDGIYEFDSPIVGWRSNGNPREHSHSLQGLVPSAVLSRDTSTEATTGWIRGAQVESKNGTFPTCVSLQCNMVQSRRSNAPCARHTATNMLPRPHPIAVPRCVLRSLRCIMWIGPTTPAFLRHFSSTSSEHRTTSAHARSGLAT